MGDEVKLVDISLNGDLIHPNFDGYKLTLDQLPIKELSLPVGLPIVEPSDTQFSIQHVKIFAAAGALFFDSWSSSDQSAVFIVPQKDGKFYRAEYDVQTRQWHQLEAVLPDPLPQNGDAFPVSLSFPSADVAVLCRGGEKVEIFQTTEGRMQWKAVFEFTPFAGVSAHILDSRLFQGKLELLLEAITDHEKTSEDDHCVFDHIVTWVTIETESWTLSHQQDLLMGGHADYVAFDENSDNLIVVSSKPPTVLRDSNGLLEKEKPKKEEEEMETDDSSEEKKHYVWTEKGDEVAIAFQLDPSVKKTDVTVKPSVNSLYISVGGNVILDGKLGGHIAPDAGTWTVGDSNKLEVTLFKTMTGVRWSFLVEGDQRGRYEMDPALMDDAVTALEMYSSESKAPGAVGANENFNSEQLEECDMTDDEMSTIYWFNRQKQAVVQQCDITGHQFLFDGKATGSRSFCLRCDVDGALFRLSDGQMVHSATFNAFGYIQASKSLRRWSVSSPDNSYACIAEASNHAFIYWQPNDIDTELRNRKTKQLVASVAKQHVISLKSRDDTMSLDGPRDYRILAAHATNQVLFLATSDTIYAVCLK